MMCATRATANVPGPEWRPGVMYDVINSPALSRRGVVRWPGVPTGERAVQREARAVWQMAAGRFLLFLCVRRGTAVQNLISDGETTHPPYV